VHTSVATATLLVNTTPVHIGLYAVLVLRQRLHPRFVAGAALAFAGAAVLLGISWDDVDDARGALLALAAAVFYAGYLLLMSAARRRADALPALWLASLGATGALGVYALLGGDALSGFPARSWAAMLGAALVSQIGGVMGIVWSLRYLPTTVASVALLAQPVGTALLGWWLLDEALTPLQALGGATVLAGIGLASMPLSRAASRRRAVLR
jgi:drug/metabolite transporter (DMT)-like permease